MRCHSDRQEHSIPLRIAGRKNITTTRWDVRHQSALNAFIARLDMVVSAVPGFAGFETRRSIIAPERLGESAECIRFLLDEIAGRDVLYKETRLFDAG
jgi:hypothetical protein